MPRQIAHSKISQGDKCPRSTSLFVNKLEFIVVPILDELTGRVPMG